MGALWNVRGATLLSAKAMVPTSRIILRNAGPVRFCASGVRTSGNPCAGKPFYAHDVLNRADAFTFTFSAAREAGAFPWRRLRHDERRGRRAQALAFQQRSSVATMPRILIVEDEPIIALNYASILEEAGLEVAGPVGTVKKGLTTIATVPLDGAILDIDLAGVPVDPIVMALRRKGLPYIFVSAFPNLVGPYRDAIFLEKPCTASDLINAATALVARASPFDGLDPRTWDAQTLDLLQEAVKEALEVYRRQLDGRIDCSKAAGMIAAKAVTDLALTGVRDLRRLTNFALLALQSSSEKEMQPAPAPCDS
jgi:CheY-like chemotaxis protein